MSYHSLTQLVKVFTEGAQLQSVRTAKLNDRWLMIWDLYPEPRHLLWGAEGVSTGLKPQLNPAPNPLQLYLKAHFANQRVRAASLDAQGRLLVEFLPRPVAALFEWQAGGKLHVTLKVPDRKDYVQCLPMASIKELEPQAAPSAVEANEKPQPSPKPDKKRERLLDKIRGDMQEGESWLRDFAPLCQALELDPRAWEHPQGLDPHLRELAEAEIAEGRLPPWGAQSVGHAQDLLFKGRRRAQKKIVGAAARLKKVEAQTPPAPRPLVVRASADGGEPPRQLPSRFQLPKKKPGLWVRFDEEGKVFARVGKSATENAELFRQARDRDVWFHVRGSPGGHVWIPRGQAGFGSKDELSETLINWGCQLALFNSKLKDAGSGADVDFSERRNLKALKGGGPGKVQIMKSQTRFARLDPLFERKVRGQ